jgi:GTPase SAR1 family protein
MFNSAIMYSFNKIYANGCSFSCAGGLNYELIRREYKDILNISIDNYIEYAYPNVIANLLNINIFNDAESGGSLNRIIRTTYQYIYNNQIDISNTLFILEVPPGWRDEIYSNKLDRFMNVTWGTINILDNNFGDIANGDNILDIKEVHSNLVSSFNNFTNTDIEIQKSMNNFLGLLSFMKLQNIKFVIIDNAGFETFLKSINYKNNFDFIWFEDKQMHIWFMESKLTISDELGIKIDGHAGIEGNIKIAEIILKYLSKMNHLK